jgi:hypothetical protein
VTECQPTTNCTSAVFFQKYKKKKVAHLSSTAWSGKHVAPVSSFNEPDLAA